MKSGKMNVQNSVTKFEDEEQVGGPRARGHHRWTNQEEVILRTEWLNGTPIGTIADLINEATGTHVVTYLSVSTKAHNLNLPPRKRRPRSLRYSPIEDPTLAETLSATRKTAKKKPQIKCLGPCGKLFSPSHQIQRICSRCREIYRQCYFS